MTRRERQDAMPGANDLHISSQHKGDFATKRKHFYWLEMIILHLCLQAEGTWLFDAFKSAPEQVVSGSH